MDEILVVDDEASVVEVVALYLKREGFAVRTAKDGREALEAIERYPPALVVLDLMLPKVAGMEIMRRLRDDPLSRALQHHPDCSGGESGHRRLPAAGTRG